MAVIHYAWVVAQTPASGQAALSYTSKYNSLDVVPHAWQSSSVAMIPTIYEPSIKPPASAKPTETITGSLAVGAALNALNTTGAFGIPLPSEGMSIAASHDNRPKT
jgi:hypothetical protein